MQQVPIIVSALILLLITVITIIFQVSMITLILIPISWFYSNNFQLILLSTILKLIVVWTGDSTLLLTDLSEIGYIPDEGIIHEGDSVTNEKNKFNFTAVSSLLDAGNDFVFSKSGCYINDFSVLKRNCDSYPYNTSLENALRLPVSYDNYVMTRASPCHTLSKVIPYLHRYPRESNKSLVIYLQSLDIDEEIEMVKKEYRYS